MSQSDHPTARTRGGGVRGTVRAQYERASTPPPIAVIETIAIALDRKETALELLYESVDPDALDALLQSNGSSARWSSAQTRPDGC
jgi:transcriptional regulator with XRE-family HTH domain